LHSSGTYFNEISDPCLLATQATASKYTEDYPSFNAATCGPFQDEFRQAMYVELNTLINNLIAGSMFLTQEKMSYQVLGLSKSNAIQMVK
jgi:hypothetical protein